MQVLSGIMAARHAADTDYDDGMIRTQFHLSC